MVAVKWQDGSVVRAANWKRLLGGLRREQWEELDLWLFRWKISERAKIWSGQWPDPRGSAEEFGRRLGEVGFFEIVEDTVDTRKRV